MVGEWELELEWESKWAGRRGTDVVVVALYLTVATLPDVTLAMQMREVGVEPNRPLTYRGSTYFGTNPSLPCLSLHSFVCPPPPKDPLLLAQRESSFGSCTSERPAVLLANLALLVMHRSKRWILHRNY